MNPFSLHARLDHYPARKIYVLSIIAAAASGYDLIAPAPKGNPGKLIAEAQTREIEFELVAAPGHIQMEPKQFRIEIPEGIIQAEKEKHVMANITAPDPNQEPDANGKYAKRSLTSVALSYENATQG